MVPCCISWCSHPPWRRNGQPPRDLCLYSTTPEEKPSKAPLSHETGQVDNVPAQERLPQTSWQSQWHCWTSPLHVWSLVTLHGSRWSAPISTTYAFVYFWNWIWSSKTFWKHSRLPMATQHFQNHNTPKHSKEGFQWPSSTSNSMNTLRQLMWFFLMSQAKLISHCTVCNFPTVYTLSWYGVTKESPLCVVHRSFGSLACMAANTGRLQRKLLGRSAI